MDQQLAYKLLAGFLVFTMLGSVFAYFFIGGRDDTTQDPQTPDTNLDKYNPEFWTVNQPFNSISDALSMTPVDAEEAYFVDLENMPIKMLEWTRSGNRITSGLIQEMDTKIYKSNTTKLYYALLKGGNNETSPPFLLLSTMSPPKNDFDYYVIPNTSNILQRQDTGAINIMGTPVIYAPTDKIAGDVIDIIYSLNKSVTAYDQYEKLLNKVEPVAYQMVSSNVSFARQFYVGIGLNNGSYERNTVYLNANTSVLMKLNQSRANSTERGFQQYIVNQSGNYTTVKIVSPELLTVLSEETS
ncbi:MAG TPA: hypothetical protein VKL21_10045 [Candidatus Methanoperedens sp.]|nr:hypothetical protein [Candidatus Methanoperedens sp.]